MWKDMLEEIALEKNSYGEMINKGAEEKEIEKFLKEANNQLNIKIPEDYVGLLQYVNGLEFNGYILYGIDQVLSIIQPNQRINGLIENNNIWRGNTWHKKYIFIGESDISWYVFDPMKQKYYVLDKPSGQECESFDDLESLICKILKEAMH